jgi:hypothetical protein
MRNSPEELGDAVMEMVHVMANTLTPASAFKFYDRIADECSTAAQTVEEIFQDERDSHGRGHQVVARRPKFVWPIKDELGGYGRSRRVAPSRSRFVWPS